MVGLLCLVAFVAAVVALFRTAAGGSLAERIDGRRLEGASSWAQMSVHGGAQQGALPGNRLQRGRGAASDISGGLASRSVATSAERG